MFSALWICTKSKRARSFQIIDELRHEVSIISYIHIICNEWFELNLQHLLAYNTPNFCPEMHIKCHSENVCIQFHPHTHPHTHAATDRQDTGTHKQTCIYRHKHTHNDIHTVYVCTTHKHIHTHFELHKWLIVLI